MLVPMAVALGCPGGMPAADAVWQQGAMGAGGGGDSKGSGTNYDEPSISTGTNEQVAQTETQRTTTGRGHIYRSSKRIKEPIGAQPPGPETPRSLDQSGDRLYITRVHVL
jgi:hypothetical protein